MALKARWRKTKGDRWNKYQSGFELSAAGKWIIIVSLSDTGWYWYGLNRNTLSEGSFFLTALAAKADAVAAYKASLG